MRTIWKYQIPIKPTVVIEMPKGAKIFPHLAAVSQDKNHLVIWAEVDDRQPKEDRTFHIFGTGHEIPEHRQLDYIGTVPLRFLVWHLYERNFQREQMIADNLEVLKGEIDD